MKLIITVEFGNDAMSTLAEAFDSIADAFKNRVIGKDIPVEDYEMGRWRVLDSNGNTVGMMELVEA